MIFTHVGAQSGTLLNVIPSESPAEVLLNNISIGIAYPNLSIQLAPGTYILTVKKPGRSNFEQQIIVGNSGLTVFALLGAPSTSADKPAAPPSPPAITTPPVKQSVISPKMVSIAAGRTSASNGNIEVKYAFEIGAYEVTNGEFLAFLNDPDSKVSPDGKLSGYRMLDMTPQEAQIKHNGSSFYIVQGIDAKGNTIDLTNYPVVYVTWYGAAAYCNWLSQKAGLKTAYNKDLGSYHQDFFRDDQVGTVEGYRLGLPNEWQYAARGGTAGKPTQYAGSDNGLEVGWFNENTKSAAGASRLYLPSPSTGIWFGTMPVGQKKANELGLYDMSGNVDEKLHDRSQRGGNYGAGVNFVNLYQSSSAHPDNANSITGFRVFRTAIGNPRPITAGTESSTSTNTSTSKSSSNYAFQFVPLSGLVNLRAAVRGPDRFLIAGDGSVIYSSVDGKTWTKGSKVPLVNVTHLEYGNGLYIATGDNGGIAISKDATTWTISKTNMYRHLLGAIWTGDQFIVVGQYGSILTSKDGTTWSSKYSSVSSHIMGISHNKENGTIVAITIDGIALVSKDGTNWTRKTVAVRSGSFYSIASGPKGFITATIDGVLYYSPDGSSWTIVYQGTGASGYSALYFDGNNYIAGGTGHILVSEDGKSWNTIALPQNKPLGKSTSYNGLIITVSSDGTGVFIASNNAQTSTSEVIVNLPELIIGTTLSFGIPYTSFQYYVTLYADGTAQQQKITDDATYEKAPIARWKMQGTKLELYAASGELLYTLIKMFTGWDQVWYVEATRNDPPSWITNPPRLKLIQ